MFFVEARYHRDPSRAGAQVRYIAHREEGLTDGQRRELYGIGERYRALRGDERAIRKALHEDGRGLRNPVYFRFILTVDNPTAARFQRFDGHLSERVMRDAVEKTFRSAARGAQGVFAVHQHGGKDRLAHPHVHALLSPRFENRIPVHISPVRLLRIKESWEREVLRGLERQERRLVRAREAWLIRRRPTTTIATSDLRCIRCHRGRRHAGTVKWSYSRRRGDRWGSRGETASSGSGCGSAGVVAGGN